MPIAIGLLLALSFSASLAALGFLIWAIARRQFALSQSDASTISEPGKTAAPDDDTAFGRAPTCRRAPKSRLARSRRPLRQWKS